MADGTTTAERTVKYCEKNARYYEEQSRKYQAIALEVVALFVKHGLRVHEANTVLDCAEHAINCPPVTQHDRAARTGGSVGHCFGVTYYQSDLKLCVFLCVIPAKAGI